MLGWQASKQRFARSLVAALVTASALQLPPGESTASGTDETLDRTSADPGGGSLGEVIYHQERRVSRDGTVTETVVGSNVLLLADGSEFTIGFDQLQASDGRRFAIIGDVSQESEDADVVYTLQVVEDRPLALSEDQLVQAWLDVYPDASDAKLAAFSARRAESAVVPEPTIEVDALVADWLETAADDDRATIWVKLAEALQEDMLAALEESGATLTGRLWSVNALLVEADAATIRDLAVDPTVARIELDGGSVDETVNRGEEIRVASQIDQYLGQGLDGSQGSGRTLFDTIVVGIVDNKVDIDHPAWDDCGFVTCDSRLLWQDDYTGGPYGFWWFDTVGGTDPGVQHGNWVASQLTADLTQGQDATIPGSTERKARTGMTTESSFIAISKDSPGTIDLGLERGIELNVDIMNLSAGCSGCTFCDLTHIRNDLANVAFLDGVFFTKGAGNFNHSTADCTVYPPGTAAGAFVTTGYSHAAANLNTAAIQWNSSRGGDAHGRAVVDITAANGRGAGRLVEYDDSYRTGPHQGTSLATPVSAGAAANLKHRLIDGWGPGLANDPGFLHVQMLLMGDGQREVGGYAGTTTPVDDLWGTGRQRMRMWNSVGLDAPYRARWFKRIVEDGMTVSDPTYPDESGVNQALPTDVDMFKLAMWWFDPNLNNASATPAAMRTRVCDQDNPLVCYVHETTDPDAHRIQLSNSFAGRRWRVDVTGLDVPINLGPDTGIQ